MGFRKAVLRRHLHMPLVAESRPNGADLMPAVCRAYSFAVMGTAAPSCELSWCLTRLVAYHDHWHRTYISGVHDMTGSIGRMTGSTQPMDRRGGIILHEGPGKKTERLSLAGTSGTMELRPMDIFAHVGQLD